MPTKLINTRLIIAFSTLLGLILLLSLSASRSFTFYHDESLRLRNEVITVYADLNKLRADVGNLRRFEKDVLLNLENPSQSMDYFILWQTLIDTTKEDISRLESLPYASEQMLSLALETRLAISNYEAGMRDTVAKITSGQITQVSQGNRSLEPYKRFVRLADQQLSQVDILLNEAEENANIDLRQSYQLGMIGIAVSTFFALLIAAGLIWFIARTAKQTNTHLQYLATHDELTGWYNRYGLQLEFDQQLTDASIGAMLYIDLDQFKVVNDICGHLAGDRMLAELSRELNNCLPNNAIKARIGGDEFAVLFDRGSGVFIKHVAREILRVISAFSFTWQDRNFRVTASIGGYNLKANDSYEIALACADAACFAAKEDGRNRYHAYTEQDSTAELRQQMHWAANISSMIENNQLHLAHQQIVPLQKDQQSTHCEVLLRIPDENGNLVLPANFIPAAERFSLMPEIDRWVIDKALSNIAERGTLSEFDVVSINLSGTTLVDDGIDQYIIEKIASYGVNAKQICFEITETTAIKNFDLAQSMINRVRQQGCMFSLDDFGTGLASFDYLKRLPIDYLKIDGVFIRRLNEDTTDLAMVKSVVAVCHARQIKTVAEFIDDGATADTLRTLGVDFGQGYFFHRPTGV